MIQRLEQAARRTVPRETFEKLAAYVGMLREEAGRQNLVSATTLEHFWERHILDSAQLIRFESKPRASWVDVGAGAGLPGIVIACIVAGPVTLIEPRRRRADFLHSVCESLRLNASVVLDKVERVGGRYDVITARAVARLDQLLGLCAHLSTKNTVWVLPKGRSAEAELADAQKSWQGVFHVEQSVTDADSRIVVATGVRARP